MASVTMNLTLSLAEIKKQYGKEFDVKPFIRDYVGSLSHIHETMRAILKTDMQSWEKTIASAEDQYQQKYPEESPRGVLAVIAKDDDGMYRKTEPLTANPIKYRKYLERKNRALGDLAKRYVTSEVLE